MTLGVIRATGGTSLQTPTVAVVRLGENTAAAAAYADAADLSRDEAWAAASAMSYVYTLPFSVAPGAGDHLLVHFSDFATTANRLVARVEAGVGGTFDLTILVDDVPEYGPVEVDEAGLDVNPTLAVAAGGQVSALIENVAGVTNCFIQLRLEPADGGGIPAVEGPIIDSNFTMATDKLLGRTTAASGAIEELSVAGELTIDAGVLTGTGAPLPFLAETLEWHMTNASAGLWFGGDSGTAGGTFLQHIPTFTNLWTAKRRVSWSNVVTTLNQVLGQRNNSGMFFRGNVAGQGGYFFFARGGTELWTNGGRLFAGLFGSTAIVTTNPSTQTHFAGFAVEDTDAGAISFMTRGASGTVDKVATGYTLAANTGYDFYFECDPNGLEIRWRIVDIVAGTQVSGAAAANLPGATNTLLCGVLASNAALTPVDSVKLSVLNIYCRPGN